MIHTPITLRRTGSFNINVGADDATQCGRVRGQRKLDYEVEIKSHSGCLDHNGFVIENGEIQRYFNVTYLDIPKLVSCELIAVRAINDLREIAGAERCMEISVSIIPQPLVKLTATQEFACCI